MRVRLMAMQGLGLIDPTDIRIVANGGPIETNEVGVDIINNTLRGSDVIISTSTAVGPEGEGNITQREGANIEWDSGRSLTLRADSNITLNADIRGGGDIALEAGKNITLNNATITASINGTGES